MVQLLTDLAKRITFPGYFLMRIASQFRKFADLSSGSTTTSGNAGLAASLPKQRRCEKPPVPVLASV
jgi:hypothetical protein